MKCSPQRVWIDPTNKKVVQAITRSDVRGFIKDGIIVKIPMKKAAKNIAKKQQRRGSVKGAKGGRQSKKAEWFKKIRPQREMIKEMREKGQMKVNNYRIMYKLVKGGMFRSRAHLTMYLKENKILKEVK